VTNDEFGGFAPWVVLQYGGRWRRFTGLARVVVAGRIEEVGPAVREVEQAVNDEGYYAAGYLAYEAGAAYGLSVHPSPLQSAGWQPAPQPPLLWFGLFRDWQAFEPPRSNGDYQFGEWRPSLDPATYRGCVARIKDAIAAGETYQTNFTFHLGADFSGDPYALFANLVAAQRADYCAYVDLGRFAICSASPELFCRLDGTSLESRPMKGTAPRGLTTAADRRQIEWLRASEKNRAENVMIVDMIRNDLGRVAQVGSVNVPALFTVERYPTLLQMTSTVRAETTASWADILAATFPCASITGAPKVRTMRIITELERGPRGVYTGAVGFLVPGRRSQFNVAIRTAVIDRRLGRATYGVGSGVVWDSDANAEYDECLLKARVLETRHQGPSDFCLLETMRWTPEEGYFLLSRHRQRLVEAAEYFSFPLDEAAVERALADLAAGLAGPSKARLLLDHHGRIAVEARPLADDAPSEPARVGLARTPVSSADARLYHKTTRREPYEAARASRPDCDEVILWNERGEVTEAGASNVVVEIAGRRLTPPVESGLLAGTLRAQLLADGEIEERVLTVDDLRQASRLWLINSVRGLMPAILCPP
jgi:para-aminobenzoate synthetase/4-amino-4-deoxychorismate lyase